MGSSRLPGKVMAHLGNKLVLDHVAERCAAAKECAAVIIATHQVPNHRGYTVIPGPEEPAARFLKVLRDYPCDGFVRVCADSPFIDSDVVNAAAWEIKNGKEYCLAGGGQPGNQAEGFLTKAFVRAEPCMTGEQREHLGIYFQERMRLTIDTPADLERARLIVSRMEKPHTEYTAAECLALLRQ